MAYDRIVTGGALEAVRREFYTIRNRYLRQGKACKVCFEALLALYDDPSLTMEERAIKADLSLNIVRRLYERYFRPLYGGRGWVERYKAYHKPEAARLRELRAEFRALPWVEHIYPLAVGAGHTVAPIINHLRRGGDRREPYMLKTMAMISGRRCIAYPITSVRYTSTAGMRARPHVRKETISQADACLFPILVRKEIETDLSVLVIPTPTVLELMGERRGDNPMLTIDLDSGLSGTGRRPKFDPHRFDNAWDLLLAA